MLIIDRLLESLRTMSKKALAALAAKLFPMISEKLFEGMSEHDLIILIANKLLQEASIEAQEEEKTLARSYRDKLDMVGEEREKEIAKHLAGLEKGARKIIDEIIEQAFKKESELEKQRRLEEEKRLEALRKIMQEELDKKIEKERKRKLEEERKNREAQERGPQCDDDGGVTL